MDILEAAPRWLLEGTLVCMVVAVFWVRLRTWRANAKGRR